MVALKMVFLSLFCLGLVFIVSSCPGAPAPYINLNITGGNIDLPPLPTEILSELASGGGKG